MNLERSAKSFLLYKNEPYEWVFHMGTPTHYYIHARASLIAFALSEFVARIVLGMSVLHGSPCPIKKVFILISPRHIV